MPPHRKAYKSEKDSKRDFVESLKRNESEFEIVVNDDGLIDTLTTSLHSNLSSSADSSAEDNEYNSTRKSRYEIPDDHLISRKATKILGNRKEVEMHEFKTIASRPSSSSSSSGSKNQLQQQRRHSDYSCVPTIDPSGERDSPTNEMT